jgi:hypothetical protein
VRAGNDQVVAALASCQINPPNELRKEFPEKIREKNSEGLCLASDETAGDPVGNIAELLHDAPDAPPRLFPNRPLVIEGARNARDGDARLSGDVLDRGLCRRPLAAGEETRCLGGSAVTRRSPRV